METHTDVTADHLDELMSLYDQWFQKYAPWILQEIRAYAQDHHRFCSDWYDFEKTMPPNIRIALSHYASLMDAAAMSRKWKR